MQRERNLIAEGKFQPAVRTHDTFLTNDNEDKIMSEQLMTIPVIAAELGIAYETAHKWIATKCVVPSMQVGKAMRLVKRADFEVFATAYKRGDYERWPK